jgi:hypothetical protein
LGAQYSEWPASPLRMSRLLSQLAAASIVTCGASSLARASRRRRADAFFNVPRRGGAAAFFDLEAQIAREDVAMKEMRSPEALYALIFAICVLIALFLLTS